MKKLMLIALLLYLPAHAMEEELKKAVCADDAARVHELLEQGANVHGRYTYVYKNCTVLHLAAIRDRNCDIIVQDLLNHGADINAQKEDNWTPLHMAAFAGRDHIVMLLLNRGADTSVKSVAGQTPYDVARGEIRSIIKNFRLLSRIKGIPMSADESAD